MPVACARRLDLYQLLVQLLSTNLCIWIGRQAALQVDVAGRPHVHASCENQVTGTEDSTALAVQQSKQARQCTERLVKAGRSSAWLRTMYSNSQHWLIWVQCDKAATFKAGKARHRMIVYNQHSVIQSSTTSRLLFNVNVCKHLGGERGRSKLRLHAVMQQIFLPAPPSVHQNPHPVRCTCWQQYS